MTRVEVARGVLLGIGVAAVVSLLSVLNAHSASHPGSADAGSRPPSSVDWTKVRIEPDHVQILMTRLFPFGLTPCSCPEGIGMSAAITLRPDNPSAFQATVKAGHGRFLATSVLASDRAATLRIALGKQLTRGEEGQFTASITASHVGIAMDPLDYTPSGTYDGTLSIGPTKKNSLSVPVTVTVQDLFVWPLFAVLVGALGAWWLIRWHDETRQKKLIKAEIAEAAKRYKSSRDTIVEYNQLYTLDGLIDPEWKGTCPCPPGSPRASELYCKLLTSKSQEQMSGISVEIADIVKRVDLWPQVCDAIGELGVAWESLEQHHASTPMSRATGAILNRCSSNPPGDVPQTLELLDTLRKQKTALELCEAYWRLSTDVSIAYESVATALAENKTPVPEDVARLHALDPQALRRPGSVLHRKSRQAGEWRRRAHVEAVSWLYSRARRSDTRCTPGEFHVRQL